VLLPMVTDLDDVTQARHALEAAARELGIAPVPLGAMIETPSSALMAAELAGAVDFLSIGTNDLAQYTLAIDRGHPRLAGRLDALHPAVLRLIAQVAQAGRARGKPVSVCGALASDVDALPLLIGLGIREISATAASIPRLKRTARLLHAGECAELAQRALEQTSAAAVRDLTAVARARARAGAATGELP
jgi:phosphoenolpyruvate-protein kinase (PTS system EI component)